MAEGDQNFLPQRTEDQDNSANMTFKDIPDYKSPD